MKNSTSSADPYIAESDRIRDEYKSRRMRLPEDRYHPRHPVNHFYSAQTARAILRELTVLEMFPLGEKTVVDIGCGPGDWLLEFMKWGVLAENLHGIDLDANRTAIAQRRLPSSQVVFGNATNLPWPCDSMDIVTQFTTFTSILDPRMKTRVAEEMVRVLKPSGVVLWYDFHFDNPANSSVRGIKAREIRELFHGLKVQIHRLTLAPPIARVVVPISWTGALMLEAIPFLRTHHLAVIRK